MVLLDTPGVTKMNNQMRSNLLVSRAWEKITDQDMAIFVVDSVKRPSMDVKGAVVRLSRTKVDPSDRKLQQAMKDGSFSQERLDAGEYAMTPEEKALYSFHIPSILVMNKVDLLTSKRRLKALQSELTDLCPFEHVFHVSCETGFGVEALQEHLRSRAELRPWRYHPNQTSTKSEVQKAEEAVKQAIMERFHYELPYHVGIQVRGWVPKLNGELRIDFHLDVKTKIQTGILLGTKGRIIKEIRERTEQLLEEQLQRPVVCLFDVGRRSNTLEEQNAYDEETRSVYLDHNRRRAN